MYICFDQLYSSKNYNSLEKEMAIYSSILAWKVPWSEDPGGLQSMGSQKSQTQLSDWAEL